MIGAVTPVDEEYGDQDWEILWDDVSGEQLNPNLVREARSEEMGISGNTGCTSKCLSHNVGIVPGKRQSGSDG